MRLASSLFELSIIVLFLLTHTVHNKRGGSGGSGGGRGASPTEGNGGGRSSGSGGSKGGGWFGESGGSGSSESESLKSKGWFGKGGGGDSGSSSGRRWFGGKSNGADSSGGVGSSKSKGWFGKGSSKSDSSASGSGGGWFGKSSYSSGGWFGRRSSSGGSGAGSHADHVGTHKAIYQGSSGMTHQGLAVPPRPAIARRGYIYNARQAHASHYGPMRTGFVGHYGYYGQPGFLAPRTMPIAMFVHRPVIYPCCPFVYSPDYHRNYFYGYSNYNERFYNAAGDDKPVSDAPIVCRYNITDDDTHFNNVTYANGTKVEEILYECDADTEFCCDGLDCCKRDDQGLNGWQILLVVLVCIFAVILCIFVVILCVLLCYCCAQCCCTQPDHGLYSGGPIAVVESPASSPIYRGSPPSPIAKSAVGAEQPFGVESPQNNLSAHFPSYRPSTAFPRQPPGVGKFYTPLALVDGESTGAALYKQLPATKKRPIGFIVDGASQTDSDERNRSGNSRKSKSNRDHSGRRQR